MSGLTIFGDWGTSRLRLFRMEDGRPVERLEGPGIGSLDVSPAETLAAVIAPLRAGHAIDRVILCGMAGAHGGLVEAGYVACPARVSDWAGRSARLSVDGLDVIVAAGLSARHADDMPDVMRGEETQIFGALALLPNLAHGRHQLVLPGTHAKWADIDEGAVSGFRTYPTGELFDLLSKRSTLVARGRAGSGEEGEGFAEGLSRSGPEMFGHLFAGRASQLVDGRSDDWARGFLSGLLIGSEVKREAAGQVVTVVGDGALSNLYMHALDLTGSAVRQVDGDRAALAGLQRVAKELA